VFPKISIRGSPDEIGFVHGRQLSKRIRATIRFYTGMFRKAQDQIFEAASYYQARIEEFDGDYATEIEALARGAEVNPLWIYALNARTEILAMDAGECTAVFFRKSGILGQNWDWARELEALSVLLEIERVDGHKILTLTEPGIIGKIGMNSSGLGVCLNILRIDGLLNGVPVHVVLRALLDSTTLKEARHRLKRAGAGKASNILVGSGQGECLDLEFAGDEVFELHPETEVMIHTNHFLARNINPDRGSFRSSYARLRTAQAASGNIGRYSFETLRKILSDRSHQEYPIYREYTPHAVVGNIGTVATIIMDLRGLKMHVRKGQSTENGFSVNSLH
jgi:isopenicillin-N N-acyltransferase-like protein